MFTWVECCPIAIDGGDTDADGETVHAADTAGSTAAFWGAIQRPGDRRDGRHRAEHGAGLFGTRGGSRAGLDFEGFKFSQSSKQQLMDGLAVAIQHGQVGYPDGVIVSELEQFEYEYTRTGVRYSAPQGFHDDCVCALALAVRKKTIPVAGEGWVAFMGRQAAEAQLAAEWSKIPSDVDQAAFAAVVADGTAETRENFGMKEWRRKPDAPSGQVAS